MLVLAYIVCLAFSGLMVSSGDSALENVGWGILVFTGGTAFTNFWMENAVKHPDQSNTFITRALNTVAVTYIIVIGVGMVIASLVVAGWFMVLTVDAIQFNPGDNGGTMYPGQHATYNGEVSEVYNQ